MQSADEKRKKEIFDNSRYSQASAFFTAVRQKSEQDLEKKGKIWRNEEFLAIDKSRSAAEPTEFED